MRFESQHHELVFIAYFFIHSFMHSLFVNCLSFTGSGDWSQSQLTLGEGGIRHGQVASSSQGCLIIQFINFVLNFENLRSSVYRMSVIYRTLLPCHLLASHCSEKLNIKHRNDLPMQNDYFIRSTMHVNTRTSAESHQINFPTTLNSPVSCVFLLDILFCLESTSAVFCACFLRFSFRTYLILKLYKVLI